MNLRPYQLKLAEAVINSVIANDGAEIVSEWSRQSGKTEVIANIVYFLTVFMPIIYPERFGKDGFRVGIFAPTYDQAYIDFQRLKSRFSGKKCGILGIRFATRGGDSYLLNNRSVVRCHTTTEGTKIEGFTYDMVVLEEAQDINDDKITKSIYPMLAATNGPKVLVGTPSLKLVNRYFYDTVQRLSGGWKEGDPALYSPYAIIIPYYEVMRYTERYSKHIERQKVYPGMDSDAFRTQYGLAWIVERSLFCSMDMFNRHIMGDHREIKAAEEYRPESSTHITVGGIDWGKQECSTVLTIIDYDKATDISRVLYWLELVGDDYVNQYEYIMKYILKFGCVRVCCDSTGTQDMIVDRLRKDLPKVDVLGIKLTMQAQDAIFKFYHEKILLSRFRFPALRTDDGDWLAGKMHIKAKMQLTEVEKEYIGGLLKVHKPSKKGAHDDFVDSMALALWATHVTGGGIIECDSELSKKIDGYFYTSSANKPLEFLQRKDDMDYMGG
jgi:hypothetical protein